MQTTLLRSVTISMVASMLAVSAAFGQTAPTKVGFINSQKILAEAPGRAEAEATFDKEMGATRAQIQRMTDSLQGLAAAFDKEAPAMDSVKREARAKSIREQEQAFSERARTLDQQMQQRQAELARPLMDQVTKVLEEFRAQGNYAFILDVASQSQVVVAADKSLDLSDQILARLKQLGPPKSVAAQPTTAVPMPGPANKPAGVTRPR